MSLSMMTTKVCINCKQEFKKRDNEHISAFIKRQYCSRKCSALDRKRKNRLKPKPVPKDNKLCLICETWFSRPKGKSNKVWKNQICCGRDCSAIYRRRSNEERAVKRRKQLNPGARRFERSL